MHLVQQFSLIASQLLSSLNGVNVQAQHRVDIRILVHVHLAHTVLKFVPMVWLPMYQPFMNAQ